jgi:hypothetical protein
MGFEHTLDPRLWNSLINIYGVGCGTSNPSLSDFNTESVFNLLPPSHNSNDGFLLAWDLSSLSFVEIFGPLGEPINIGVRAGDCRGPFGASRPIRPTFEDAKWLIKPSTMESLLFDFKTMVLQPLTVHPVAIKIAFEKIEPTWVLDPKKSWIARNQNTGFPYFSDIPVVGYAEWREKGASCPVRVNVLLLNLATGTHFEISVQQQWDLTLQDLGGCDIYSWEWVSQDPPATPWFSEDGKKIHMFGRESSIKFNILDPDPRPEQVPYSEEEELERIRFSIPLLTYLKKKEFKRVKTINSDFDEDSEIPEGKFWNLRLENLLEKEKNKSVPETDPLGVLTFDLEAGQPSNPSFFPLGEGSPPRHLNFCAGVGNMRSVPKILERPCLENYEEFLGKYGIRCSYASLDSRWSWGSHEYLENSDGSTRERQSYYGGRIERGRIERGRTEPSIFYCQLPGRKNHL